MSLYERKSFTVPASAGKPETCAEVGHTEPDQRGKCLRCAARVIPVTPEQTPFGHALEPSTFSERVGAGLGIRADFTKPPFDVESQLRMHRVPGGLLDPTKP